MYTEIKDGANGRLDVADLLGKLNQFKDDEKIEFSNGKFLDGDYGSYRGYYDDIYFEYSYEDNGYNTIGNFKKIIYKALEEGVMEGYKGGDFSIDESTFTWLSTYGSSEGYEIIDVREIDGIIFVIVDKES
ncbi:hypothetical protein ACI3ER_11350 [Bacillus sp. Wb]